MATVSSSMSYIGHSSSECGFSGIVATGSLAQVASLHLGSSGSLRKGIVPASTAAAAIGRRFIHQGYQLLSVSLDLHSRIGERIVCAVSLLSLALRRPVRLHSLRLLFPLGGSELSFLPCRSRNCSKGIWRTATAILDGSAKFRNRPIQTISLLDQQ